MKPNRITQKALAATLSMALVGQLFGAPVIARAEEGDDTETYAQATALPAKFDLRDKGLVTPVKRQDPWGTCWSFGAIAAAESSILSEMGTTFAETPLDLSEAHLIAFGNSPVTKEHSDTQYDEGMYQKGGNGGTNTAFRGGNSVIASTLFASGVGPMLESAFPYQNHEGMTEYEYMNAHPDEWKANVKKEIEAANGKSLNQMIQERRRWDSDYPPNELIYLQNNWLNYHKVVENTDNYTEYLDWSLNEKDRNLNGGYTLIDGNTLPELALYKDGKWQGISEHGMEVTKRELMAGRAVAVKMQADTSTPGQANNNKYINLDNWAHYTYEDTGVNHSVTIVGWDDNYPKENFLSGTGANGISRTPPANGAWIVKNSWGSETDFVTNKNGRPVTKGAWGVKDASGKHTGYFYISYYDKSIRVPESYRFGEDLAGGDEFVVYEYDFLPATDGFCYMRNSNFRVSAANIFTCNADEDEMLTSVGVRTFEENTTVENEVYVLKEGTNNPENGTKVASFKCTLPYAGFHRIALPEPYKLTRGTRFSVVSTEYYKDANGKTTYVTGVNKADSESYAEYMINKQGKSKWNYGKSVINKGESYLYWGEGWYDWRECLDNELNLRGVTKAQGEMDTESDMSAQAVEEQATDQSVQATTNSESTSQAENTSSTADASSAASNETTTSAASDMASATTDVTSTTADTNSTVAEVTSAVADVTSVPADDTTMVAQAVNETSATSAATEATSEAATTSVAETTSEAAAPAAESATPVEENAPQAEESAVPTEDASEDETAQVEAQANESRYPPAIEKNSSVVDNFTLKAYTVSVSAAQPGPKRDDQATKSEPIPEGESQKGGETSLAPSDYDLSNSTGFTDEDYPDADDDYEDPDLPGDSKDYYDEYWEGDDPSEAEDDPTPQPTPQPDEQKSTPQNTDAPKSSTPSNGKLPQTGDNALRLIVPLGLAGAGTLAFGAWRKRKTEDES